MSLLTSPSPIAQLARRPRQVVDTTTNDALTWIFMQICVLFYHLYKERAWCRIIWLAICSLPLSFALLCMFFLGFARAGIVMNSIMGVFAKKKDKQQQIWSYVEMFFFPFWCLLIALRHCGEGGCVLVIMDEDDNFLLPFWFSLSQQKQ